MLDSVRGQVDGIDASMIDPENYDGKSGALKYEAEAAASSATEQRRLAEAARAKAQENGAGFIKAARLRAGAWVVDGMAKSQEKRAAKLQANAQRIKDDEAYKAVFGTKSIPPES